jgi:tRNA pseudouridine55 synthase
MYSALKMSGVPLYRYARQGINVPRASRRVTIYKIEVMRIQHPVVEFSVTCSKGTYVRSLAEDIGAALGCGAYLSKLNRTEIGPFALRDSCTITGLEQSDLLTRRGFLRPADCLLSRYPEITLDQDQIRSFSVGKSFKVIVSQPGEVRVYGANRQFLGLAMVGLDGLAQPKRVLFQG